MSKVQVIATAEGHDGEYYRHVGDVFMVDAKCFVKRPKLRMKLDATMMPTGEMIPTGEYYPPPSWFEKTVEVEKKETKLVGESQANGQDLA